MPSSLAEAHAAPVLAALRRRSAPPAAAPSGAAVVVLCASSDHVFDATQEIQQSWGVKPLSLSTAGGGRRKDQVARQAKALKEGVAVAVGSPGRVLRLLEEG